MRGRSAQRPGGRQDGAAEVSRPRSAPRRCLSRVLLEGAAADAVCARWPGIGTSGAITTMKVGGGKAAPAVVLALPAVALSALRLPGIERGPRSHARTGVALGREQAENEQDLRAPGRKPAWCLPPELAYGRGKGVASPGLTGVARSGSEAVRIQASPLLSLFHSGTPAMNLTLLSHKPSFTHAHEALLSYKTGWLSAYLQPACYKRQIY